MTVELDTATQAMTVWWDENAEDYAVAHHTYEHLDYGTKARICMGFELGGHWQRDQLRTDEAVERVANALCVEEEGMTLAEHEANCELPICGFRASFLADARRNITALLGED